MKIEEREILKLFSEKVERLESSSLVGMLRSGEARFNIHWTREEGLTFESEGPPRESVDGVVVTYRFFTQDNEPTSLSRMTSMLEHLAARGEVSQDLLGKWIAKRTDLNAFLDSPATFAHEDKDTAGDVIRRIQPDRRDLIDTFIYGEIAHSKKSKRKLIEKWKESPFLYAYIEHEFVETLGGMIGGLVWLRKQIVDPILASGI